MTEIIKHRGVNIELGELYITITQDSGFGKECVKIPTQAFGWFKFVNENGVEFLLLGNTEGAGISGNNVFVIEKITCELLEYLDISKERLMEAVTAFKIADELCINEKAL